ARVIHGVGYVPREHDVHSQPNLLANTERPSQHAHVGVHTHHHYVLNPPLAEEAVDFLAAVADAVFRGELQQLILTVLAPDRRANNFVVAWLCDVIDGESMLSGRVQWT